MSGTRTETHSGPREPRESQRGREALIAVFPSLAVLPVPPSEEPVGRGWLAGFNVDDPKVSREHLAFTRRGGLRVIDLGSHNGTCVDGAKLAANRPAEIEDGTVIRAGRTVLVYREELRGRDAPDEPLGALVSPYGLRDARAELERICKGTPTNILIEGETGTGKELVAEAIAARLGKRALYEPVNVANIPTGVFESHLFGYARGAFSGAGAGAPGVFVAHDGGAVFLDEIGELPLEIQPKLLRFLDYRDIQPVGAHSGRKVDVLVIAATNRPLAAMVADGRFRRDLFVRLAASRVELKPLGERTEDIFAIAQAEAAKARKPYDLSLVEVEAVEHLLLHKWEGNVRELIAALHRIAGHEPLPALRAWAVEEVLGPRPASPRVRLTRENVAPALARAGGNQSAAALDLGVLRSRLRRFLDRERKAGWKPGA